MPSAFVDSNVFLYAVNGRPADRAKADIARALLNQDPVHLSVQVLNEFTINAIRQDKTALTREEAADCCHVWKEENIVHPISVYTYELAQRWFQPRHLSLWDALIVASANLAECSILYSEDMNSGQLYGNVTVTNPFR